MKKKGLAVAVILLFIGVAFASSINANVNDKGKPDLKIIDIQMGIGLIPPGFPYKMIKCNVKNIGDASLDEVHILGSARHFFIRFLHGGGTDSKWSFSNDPWEPGEERWIAAVKFPYCPIEFWIDNGFFKVNMEINNPDDPNPFNNRIRGYFFILDNDIKGIYI